MKKYWTKHHQWIIGLIVGSLIPILFSYIEFSEKHRVTKEFYYASANSTVKESDLIEAKCWTMSVASFRTDAYRCMVNNEIHDPCFSLPLNHSVVSCPDYPNDDKHYFKFIDTRDIETEQKHTSLTTDENLPWYIVLDSGVECSFITGATASIANLRMDYGCDNDMWLLLPIQTDNTPHSIKCYKDSVVSDCEIDEVWY